MVSPDRQIWRCFGCNKGGDLFTFVMEMERMEFAEALRMLAEVAHVQLHTEPYETKDSSVRKRLLALNHLASEYYHYILTKHRAGTEALLYLKNRGITDKSIATFMLGFAPPGWENLGTYLRKKGYTDNEMVLAGLSIKGNRGYYDRFRNRVMFSLRNHRNEVIGFAGRVLDPTAKEAKYVNTPETPLYIKGNTLYALEITKDAIRKENKAIVVEGELDAISSFQAGVGNIVAIKGTALTEAQINLLKRFTTNIYLALDRDSAGDSATRRSIELAETAGMQVYVISVPQGKDPDEAARENPVAWKQAVKDASAYFDFLIDSALHRHTVTSAYGKKEIVDEVLPFLARITNPIVQSHYLKLLSEKLDTRQEVILATLQKLARGAVSKQPAAKPEFSQDSLELFILAYIVQSNNSALLISHMAEEDVGVLFTNPAIRTIVEQISFYLKAHATLDAAAFAQTLAAELLHTYDTALLYEVPHILLGKDTDADFHSAVKELRKRLLRRKLADLTTKLKHMGQDDPAFGELNANLSAIAKSLKKLG